MFVTMLKEKASYLFDEDGTRRIIGLAMLFVDGTTDEVGRFVKELKAVFGSENILHDGNHVVLSGIFNTSEACNAFFEKIKKIVKDWNTNKEVAKC